MFHLFCSNDLKLGGNCIMSWRTKPCSVLTVYDLGVTSSWTPLTFSRTQHLVTLQQRWYLAPLSVLVSSPWTLAADWQMTQKWPRLLQLQQVWSLAGHWAFSWAGYLPHLGQLSFPDLWLLSTLFRLPFLGLTPPFPLWTCPHWSIRFPSYQWLYNLIASDCPTWVMVLARVRLWSNCSLLKSFLLRMPTIILSRIILLCKSL